MPNLFNNASLGDVPIGWTISPTVWETNPNMIKYFNDNWAEGDGLAMPEAGVNYVNKTPPHEFRDKFFALSDEYFNRTGSGNMRVLQDDMVDPLPYAESMDNLDSVMCGYYETNFSSVNNDNQDRSICASDIQGHCIQESTCT